MDPYVLGFVSDALFIAFNTVVDSQSKSKAHVVGHYDGEHIKAISATETN